MECPLCNCKIDDIKHVIMDHAVYWENKGYDLSTFPKTIEDFNNRFGLIGLKILENCNEN